MDGVGGLGQNEIRNRKKVFEYFWLLFLNGFKRFRRSLKSKPKFEPCEK
jgi:hypothetical protein